MEDLETRLRKAERSIASLAVMCEAQGRILDALVVQVLSVQPDPKRALDALFELLMLRLDLWAETGNAPDRREAVRRFCEGIFGQYTEALSRAAASDPKT